MQMLKRETSHEWWFDSHHRTANRSSSWLQSTLGDLDMKTKSMLKLIEEDADSFAQRAEMYYKKRPELISMVEDFYRAHRSLAERYDQLKSDSGNRVLATLGSPFSAEHKESPFSAGHKGSPFSAGYQTEKLPGLYQNYDIDSSHSETYDQECAESEVDDPEQDNEMHAGKEMEAEKDPKLTEESEEEATGKSEAVLSALSEEEEVTKLRAEIKQLKEENKIQASTLLQKDEEKREVIRQLSSAMEMLKSESADLRSCLAKVSQQKTKPSCFEKFKGVFSGKFIKGTPNVQGGSVVVAL